MTGPGLPLPAAGDADAAVAIASGGAAWEIALIPRIDRARSGLHLARRCLDLADLLAVSRAGLVSVAVVAADLARLDRDQVARLRADGVAVLLVESKPTAGVALALGVSDVVSDDAPPDDVVRLLHSLARRTPTPLAAPTQRSPAPGAIATHGRLVAVGGPTGAPGRSTVATNLAAEAAAHGAQTLLIDADPGGGALATRLGVLDEAPGLAAACRSAARDRLSRTVLAGNALALDERLRLLTGSTRPDRWRELRPAALAAVCESAKELADLVVVDLGAELADDEGSLGGPGGPAAVARAFVAEADVVVLVATPDPVGLIRLVHTLDVLAEAVPEVRVVVAVNRVRESVLGRQPERAVRQAVARFAGSVELCLLPDDPRAADQSVRICAPLRLAASTSPLRAAIRGLLGQVHPGLSTAGSARAGRSRHRRRRASVPSQG